MTVDSGNWLRCASRPSRSSAAAEALGREVAADERARWPSRPSPAPAPTMYLGLDGSGVPVRPTEVEGRARKQPDGSAKTREVKLATVWTPEGRDTQGRPVRDRGSVSYNAAVESAASRDTDPQPAAFAQRVHREAIRRGFDTADRQVVVGDGAAWIWNVAAEQFPGAIEIVDIYHARQHLCDVAKAILRPRDRLGRPVGQGTAVPNWTLAGCAPSSQHCASMSRPHPRLESAFTMCSGTDTACAIRSSGPEACASRRASSRPDASSSAHGSSALDRRRRQRHHRPALLHPQWPLRGLLGATCRKRRLTLIAQ